MYQDCRVFFFSVFSNSTSCLKPKCLEDPKLFPMLPSPPQHDRQRCPVPAAATATAPTRIDSSSSFPWPQRCHWSLRHQSWGVLMASLPGVWELSPFHPQILVFKTKVTTFQRIVMFPFESFQKDDVEAWWFWSPSLTNSNQPVQQMKCFRPSPPLLTHADAAVERHHGRL